MVSMTTTEAEVIFKENLTCLKNTQIPCPAACKFTITSEKLFMSTYLRVMFSTYFEQKIGFFAKLVLQIDSYFIYLRLILDRNRSEINPVTLL